jgi:hypothetical protein
MMQKLSEPEEIARSGYSSRRLHSNNVMVGEDGEPLVDFGRSFFMKEEVGTSHPLPARSTTLPGPWKAGRACAPGPCRHAQDPYQVTRLTSKRCARFRPESLGGARGARCTGRDRFDVLRLRKPAQQLVDFVGHFTVSGHFAAL